MFTTVEEVAELTKYEVDNADIHMAQALVESYIGKVEVEVRDANDLMLLARATAYQAAYMKNDASKVFEQVSVSQISQMGQMITFKQNEDASPWIAPLAVLACKRLSWKRSRSVKTGSIFYTAPTEDGWRTR